jgi:undecaprenyl-diphosphatase
VVPASRLDLAIAKACRRRAGRRTERALKVLTWLADEKLVLAATAAFWLVSRRSGRQALRLEADRMAVTSLIVAALPHLMKRVVRRRRPDRSLVGRRRKGIPYSGNAWDSFPSGHAMHMGGLAASSARLSPRRLRPFVWLAFAALSSSRMMLLAHYFSDVLAGWGIGALVNRFVSRIVVRDRDATAIAAGPRGRPRRSPDAA